MKSIFLVSLKWDITFNDADEGRCYAGEGHRPITAFQCKESADAFVQQWLKPIADAERDTIGWPIQPNSKKLKDGLGFTLHDIDSDSENFGLAVEEIQLS
jgi:hypothetical protein